MVSYANEYRKIISKLVRESFLDLRKKEPKIIFGFKIFSGYASYFPIINVIAINKKCNKFSDNEKKGLLVHELCHVEQSSRRGFFEDIFLFILYWFSPKFRKREEENADKIAIKRGYAKELFESTKKFELEFGKMKYGFSLNQIKSYAKSIGKWQ